MSINNLNLLPVRLPKVFFGTSGLGNLFVSLPLISKLKIINEIFSHLERPVVFDTAGKYGAGLALEALGACLRMLEIPQEDVIISNKLGWKRTPLTTEEPTFEPGVWKDLKFDAEQKISYDGIMECYEQGNELLRGYKPNMVSVHDPDEYLARATNKHEDSKYYHDILEAYRALDKLKSDGEVKLIGVGAKNWKTIERISNDVNLDWVMFANSMTIKHHPSELISFFKELNQRGVHIINSAVFHSGFLTGGEYFDYKFIDLQSGENKALIDWRNDFFALCLKYHIKPAHACIQFGLAVPGTRSIALNTTNPERVKENIEMAKQPIDDQFWEELKDRGLININFKEFERKG